MKRLALASLLCAATLRAQAPVTYAPPMLIASDCLPASGSLFAVGDTPVTCTKTFTITVPPPPAFDWVRDTTELGVIHIPATGVCPATCIDFAGWGLAHDPIRDGLFITGNDNAATHGGQHVGELAIPAIGGTASWIQPLTEPTEGKFHQAEVPGTPTKIGGLAVVNDLLCGTSFAFYDGGSRQKVAVWCRPADLSDRGHVSDLIAPTFASPVALLNPARFVNTQVVSVPPEWQGRLGSVLLGGCCTNISAGDSNGPAAFGWTPGETTARPLLYFPVHLGPNAFDVQSTIWNGTTKILGGFIRGDDLMFIGTMGLGTYCYGSPTNPDPAKHCPDPESNAQGGHAPPYAFLVWGYHLKDLLANAAAGTPWLSRPYASWPLTLSPSKFHSLTGVAFDPASGRLFIGQGLVDNNGQRPVIHVVQVH